ncbi:hypothetical protein DV515_00001809, partial [Chloebia gouldiae]
MTPLGHAQLHPQSCVALEQVALLSWSRLILDLLVTGILLGWWLCKRLRRRRREEKQQSPAASAGTGCRRRGCCKELLQLLRDNRALMRLCLRHRPPQRPRDRRPRKWGVWNRRRLYFSPLHCISSPAPGLSDQNKAQLICINGTNRTLRKLHPKTRPVEDPVRRAAVPSSERKDSLHHLNPAAATEHPDLPAGKLEMLKRRNPSNKRTRLAGLSTLGCREWSTAPAIELLLRPGSTGLMGTWAGAVRSVPFGYIHCEDGSQQGSTYSTAGN